MGTQQCAQREDWLQRAARHDPRFGNITLFREEANPLLYLMERTQRFPSPLPLIHRMALLNKLSQIPCPHLALPLRYSHSLKSIEDTEPCTLSIVQPYHSFSFQDSLSLMQREGLQITENQLWYLAVVVLESCLTCQGAGLPLPDISTVALMVTCTGNLCLYPLRSSHSPSFHYSLLQLIRQATGCLSQQQLQDTANGKYSPAFASFVGSLQGRPSLGRLLGVGRQHRGVGALAVMARTSELVTREQYISRKSRQLALHLQKSPMRWRAKEQESTCSSKLTSGG